MHLFHNAFVISLTTRPDRLSTFQQRAQAAGLENIIAFPAFSPPQDITGLGRTMRRRPGSLGCLLSHLAVIKMASALKYPHVAVFEDDVVFHPEFVHRALEFATELPSTWEIYLPGSMTLWDARRYSQNLYKPSTVSGSQSYVVHARGYARLISNLETLALPVDEVLAGLPLAQEVYGVLPSLTSQMDDLSDVDGQRLPFSRTHNWAGHRVRNPQQGVMPGEPCYSPPPSAWHQWCTRAGQLIDMLGPAQAVKAISCMAMGRPAVRVLPRGLGEQVMAPASPWGMTALYHASERLTAYLGSTSRAWNRIIHLGGEDYLTAFALAKACPKAEILRVVLDPCGNAPKFSGPPLPTSIKSRLYIPRQESIIPSGVAAPSLPTVAANRNQAADSPESGLSCAPGASLNQIFAGADLLFIRQADVQAHLDARDLSVAAGQCPEIIVDTQGLPSEAIQMLSFDSHDLTVHGVFHHWARKMPA